MFEMEAADASGCQRMGEFTDSMEAILLDEWELAIFVCEFVCRSMLEQTLGVDRQ